MAQFSQDSKWYRGIATEVTSDHITVFYIDFGNTENVKREKSVLRILFYYKTYYLCIYFIFKSFVHLKISIFLN